MTEPFPSFTAPFCQADCRCEHPAVFRARLEAAAGTRHVLRRAALCAHHLGDSVYALAAWAHDQGLQGEVTVLAIDQPAAAHSFPAWRRCELVFGAIPIGT
jgi:hypothetical protein